MKLEVKKLHQDAIIPKYQTPGSAGFDLHAITDKDTILYPDSQCIISTGLAVAIPQGYEMQVRPRSGLAAKNSITVTNSPGTVDCVPKGTKIRTPFGVILVEDIYRNGEKTPVYSYNEETEQIEEDAVKDIWIVNNLKIYQLEMINGIILKIPENKEVYTQNGWKKIQDITDKDEILSF